MQTPPICSPHGGCSPRIESSNCLGDFVGGLTPLRRMSMVQAWALRALCLQSYQSFHGSLRDKDALRALGFDRAVRKLTIPALRLGKSGWHVAYPLRGRNSFSVFASLTCDCFRALWMRTRAHDTRTRARTLGLLINCSRKLVGCNSKNVTFENVTNFVT